MVIIKQTNFVFKNQFKIQKEVINMTTTTNQNSLTLNHDLDLIVQTAIIDKIAYKLLMSLATGRILKSGKGSGINMDAYNIAINRSNGVITFEDITQSMLLHLIEHSDSWFLKSENDNHQLIFTDSDVESEFYKIPSRTLYKHKTRHDNRKQWIESSDGTPIRTDDICALSSESDIDTVLSNVELQGFMLFLKNTKNKMYKRFTILINLRIQGFKYSEIAQQTGLKETTIKDSFSQLKKLWKDFHKQQ